MLIKAVAGGGGKGMRKVDCAEDFPDALDSCKREAASVFGNDVVLIEKWIESPRHIEVQVFGDSPWQCRPSVRARLLAPAAPPEGDRGSARAGHGRGDARGGVRRGGTRGAGGQLRGRGDDRVHRRASEGLRADRIWFMEMNTRLQVEHPVTEEITGVDLVEWQLRVAAASRCRCGRTNWRSTAMRSRRGSMPRTRRKGFLPSVGRLEHFDLGEPTSRQRIETGVEEGDEISPFYDPMIAKLVAHGDDRDEAIAGLADMLDEVEVWPVRTNAGFLFNALLHPAFGAAEIDTGFIAREIDDLVPDAEPDDALWRGAAAVATAEDEEESLGSLAGFRLNAAPRSGVALGRGGNFRDDRARRWRADRGGVGLSRRGAGGRLLRRPGAMRSTARRAAVSARMPATGRSLRQCRAR